MLSQDFYNSQDWALIKMYFESEIDKMKKSISYKDKKVDEIGKQYIARLEAEKILKKVISKVEYANIKPIKKESYK